MDRHRYAAAGDQRSQRRLRGRRAPNPVVDLAQMPRASDDQPLHSSRDRAAGRIRLICSASLASVVSVSGAGIDRRHG
jgi:hypothetical protein